MRAVTFISLHFACVLLLAGTVCLSPAVCFGQTGQSKSTPSPQRSAAVPQDDAVIFVNPLPQDTATIGIAYSGRVAHSTAKADVERLLAAGKWRLAGKLRIEDASVQPGQPKTFPVTTGVFFSVSQAPQVSDGSPNLRPYLAAFQRLNHFEVNFQAGLLNPYSGITKAENEILSVQLQTGEGIYSFEVTIHNHKGNIPALVNSGEAIDGNTLVPTADVPAKIQNTTVSNGKPVPTRPNILIGIAFALVVGVLVGGGAYLLLARQSSR